MRNPQEKSHGTGPGVGVMRGRILVVIGFSKAKDSAFNCRPSSGAPTIGKLVCPAVAWSWVDVLLDEYPICRKPKALIPVALSSASPNSENGFSFPSPSLLWAKALLAMVDAISATQAMHILVCFNLYSSSLLVGVGGFPCLLFFRANSCGQCRHIF